MVASSSIHRRAACAGLLCALTLACPGARANGAPVLLEAAPLLGPVAPDDGGWRSVRVRIENPSSQLVKGSLVVETRSGFTRGSPELTTVLPFAVAAKAHVSLEVPTHGVAAGGGSQIRIRAQNAQGEVVAESSLASGGSADAVVLDLTNPSRLSSVLRNRPFPSRRGAPYGTRARLAQITVAAALEDPASGDLILPELAGGYAAATLVVGSGRDLSRLSDAEQSALANWVLSGGALAVYLDRPEDFARPLIEALAGGRPVRSKAPDALSRSELFVVPSDEAEASRSSPAPPKLVRVAPSSETVKRFVGYSGANLHDTGWGASASYGLGELHLLAFDPRDVATLGDAWTRHKLVALVDHAYARETGAAVRHSASLPGELTLDGIRRELDPNQATRWTIVVSALLLLAYAGLAGPLNFYLASRKGRPLRALWQLPIWSLATLSIIMLLGLFGKGLSGRARRLTLFDAGAGLSRAAAVRFRGFYAASSRELTVRATRREHVLDLGNLSVDLARQLTVDADGARLTGLRTKPWQTVMVREDGFGELGGGVSVLSQNGEVVVRNSTGRDLIGVVVRSANGEATYIARVRDGKSARASEGTPLGTLGYASAAGATSVPLDAGRFSTTIDHDFPGLGRAWAALEPAFASDTEWWPPDVPVVLAALDGGEGKLTDSGLAVDYDRVLVRVVGEGGAL